MQFGKKLIAVLSSTIVLTILTSPALGRSVYAITKHLDDKLTAYNIRGDQIDWQATADVPSWPVGLALDPDSGVMFVTYEHKNIIEMLNAKTMISEENPVTVTEATSLAGIAFDQTNQKLYVVDRETNKLFVYLWNPVTRKLTLEGDTYKTLAGLGPYRAYGIALDESKERLYVTDRSNAVKYYDTNDPNQTWTRQRIVDVNRVAVGIAIDPNRHYLYTGSWSGQSGDHTFLVRTDINDINNPAFDEYNVGYCVIGITADEQTGFVYTTDKDDKIKVFDTATFPSDPCYADGNDISQPADIIIRGDVSYKPPFPSLVFAKDDNDVNCASPTDPNNDEITYYICYDANGQNANNVIITDFLAHEVDFNSASGPNVFYDSDSNTVTWKIGNLSPADSNCVYLTVKVNTAAHPAGTTTNYCEIESDRYYTFTTEDTNVCCWGGDIIYVDVNAPTDYNTGASWQYAYKDLHFCIEASSGRTSTNGVLSIGSKR